MLKKYVYLMLMLVIFSSSVEALIITKSAPATIELGDILTVNISIKNEGSQKYSLYVMETIINAEPIEPSKFEYIKSEDIIAAYPPFFSWQFIISPFETKQITYKIKPYTLGPFDLYKTEVFVKETEEVFYSNDLVVEAISVDNGICEPDKGENYLTKPKDCPTGSADGLCDLERDGRCDPDCEEGADLDCTCGDGECQPYEDMELCPEDCMCGNNVCDPNENIDNCLKDCHCGNSICDFDENVETCPDDCEEKHKPNYLLYGIISFIVFIIISIIFFGIKSTIKKSSY